MTHEQRLDRLERIAKLFVRAGVRYRRDLREVGDKLNIIVNMQIKSEERFTQNEAAFQSRSVEYEKRFNRNEQRFNRNEQRFNRNEKRFSRNEEKLARLSQTTEQKIADLTESQARTDRNLADLIKIVGKGRNGNPHTDS